MQNPNKTCSLILFLQRGRPLSLHLATSLNRTRCVHWVKPALIKVDEEDNVVSKAADASHGRHSNDEREEIVNERVETLVDQNTPRKVSHALHLVVQKELRRHEHKAKCIDSG